MTFDDRELLEKLRAENPQFIVTDSYVESRLTRQRHFYQLSRHHPHSFRIACERLRAGEAQATQPMGFDLQAPTMRATL